MRYNLVLHVDKADGSLGTAFTNAVNYKNALPDEKFSMVLVVNSQAVTRLVAADNADIAPALEEAVACGLDIRVCNNALKHTGVKAESLFAQCRVVQAGIVELVNLQQDGYSYVKP